MTAPTGSGSGLAGLSYTDLQGRTVYGSDGSKIGKIADLYDDDSGGAPVFATVHTGLFGNKTTFVPMTQAQLQGDDVQVPYTKDVVKGAPSIDADAEISPQEEQEIFSYYGLGGGSGSAGTSGSAAGMAGGTGTETRDYDTAATAGTAGTPGRDSATTESATGVAGTGATGAGTATAGAAGAVGHDTSGPTTDQAMTRSEEQLRVGTQNVEAGRARLRKYVVTENVTQTVPVSHEEVRIEREPITEANMPAATDGPAISEEEHEVVLHAEQPVVQKEAVPVERVRLDTQTVTEQQQVSEDVRKEQIETDGDVYPGGQSGRPERDRTI
jgi:uncharacterized protein (TIGR02271 family)